MATYSSILAWRIPWTEEPGGLCTVHGFTKSQTRPKRFSMHGVRGGGGEPGSFCPAFRSHTSSKGACAGGEVWTPFRGHGAVAAACGGDDKS